MKYGVIACEIINNNNKVNMANNKIYGVNNK
jgi:hypothetical protein